MTNSTSSFTNRSWLALAAVLLAGSGHAALAAGRPASQATKPAASRDTIKMPYTRFTLPNGLTTLVYTDRSMPIVHVGIWYRTGSKDEPPGKSGFAHLFEHLMFQQTANRKTDYLAVMGSAGATEINGSTDSLAARRAAGGVR